MKCTKLCNGWLVTIFASVVAIAAFAVFSHARVQAGARTSMKDVPAFRSFLRVGDYVIDPTKVAYIQLWPDRDDVSIVFSGVAGPQTHYIPVSPDDGKALREWLSKHTLSLVEE